MVVIKKPENGNLKINAKENLSQIFLPVKAKKAPFVKIKPRAYV